MLKFLSSNCAALETADRVATQSINGTAFKLDRHVILLTCCFCHILSLLVNFLKPKFGFCVVQPKIETWSLFADQKLTRSWELIKDLNTY